MADDGAAWRGRIIHERYLVEDVLGRGGMGVVLRARHQFTGAVVALKVLRDELARDPDLQRRFLAEARAGNAINHPGIVEVIDAGRDATGELFLVMELLVGESLRATISRGGLSAPEVRRIGLELADALGAAHARGFVHRDLKPENVFLVAPHGAVKLLDFGIAKVLATDVGTLAARTAAGVAMGTPAYMAPEQLKDARGVDARADLWAMGVMLYEMLSGRLPYRGSTFEELYTAIATADAAPISTVLPGTPPALDAFFARALARDPRYRFASSGELAAAFGMLPLGHSAAAAPHAYSQPAYSATPGLAPTQMGTSPPPPAARPPTGPVPALHAQSVPPPAARSRAPMLLGGAIAVAIGGVAIAYFATRPTSIAKPPVSDAAVAVAPAPMPPPAPLPALDAAVAIDAAPPLDAAIAIASPKPLPAAKPQVKAQPPQPQPPQPQPQPQPTVADICAAGCARLAQCGAPNALCQSQCSSRRDVASCMATVTNCNGFAACSFLIICGSVPSGGASCATIASAQSQCAFKDVGCACQAMQHLAPIHTLALAELDGCVSSVADQCGPNLNCMAQRCATQRTICVSQ